MLLSGSAASGMMPPPANEDDEDNFSDIVDNGDDELGGEDGDDLGEDLGSEESFEIGGCSEPVFIGDQAGLVAGGSIAKSGVGTASQSTCEESTCGLVGSTTPLDAATVSQYDALIGALEDLAVSEKFQKILHDFSEEHCQIFEDCAENKLEYTGVFKTWTALIEGHIEDVLGASKVMDAFLLDLAAGKVELDEGLCELLLSLSDFVLFKQMMLDAKRELGGGKNLVGLGNGGSVGPGGAAGGSIGRPQFQTENDSVPAFFLIVGICVGRNVEVFMGSDRDFCEKA